MLELEPFQGSRPLAEHRSSFRFSTRHCQGRQCRCLQQSDSSRFGVQQGGPQVAKIIYLASGYARKNAWMDNSYIIFLDKPQAQNER